MRAWLRWLRVPLAPTAACDSLACCLLAGGAAGSADLAPFAWPEALALALTSLLIYAFGMGLNDWADRARDETLAPDRPLPSGALSPGLALATLVLLAALALALGGGRAGTRGLVLAALGMAALYDLSLKAWVVPGALAMGLVRALNASLGVVPLVLAGHAPAWTLGAPAAIGLYSAAVTVLSTTEGAPDVRRAWAARLLASVAYGAAAALACLAARRLTLGSFLAAGSVLSLLFARVPRPGPVKRQVLEMLLGLYLLAAILVGGAGPAWIDLAGLVAAFLLVYLSQIAIRALGARRGGAPPAIGANDP